jgi:hypothetical protein
VRYVSIPERRHPLAAARLVSIREHASADTSGHTSAYVRGYLRGTALLEQHVYHDFERLTAEGAKRLLRRHPQRHLLPHTSAYVSIRQHTSAYVSIRQHTSAYVSIRQHTSAYVSIRQTAEGAERLQQRHPQRHHLQAYVSIREHTRAYVSIREPR